MQVSTIVLILTFLIFSLFGGCKPKVCIEDFKYEEVYHQCPKQGHGQCPICFDPQLKNNEMALKN